VTVVLAAALTGGVFAWPRAPEVRAAEQADPAPMSKDELIHSFQGNFGTIKL
jgi:hypothetical protein